MSNLHLTRVWQTSTVAGAARLVLLNLADHADDNGIAFPGLVQMGKETRLSRRAVQGALRRLEAAGEVVTTTGGRGPGDRNEYRLRDAEERAQQVRPVLPTRAQQVRPSAENKGARRSNKGARRAHPPRPPHKDEPSMNPHITTGAVVPPELADLRLYAADPNLCRAWGEMLPSWRKAHPNLDVVAQVRCAHAWELERPKQRKKDRVKFLGAWLRRHREPLGGSHNLARRQFANAGDGEAKFAGVGIHLATKGP